MRQVAQRDDAPRYVVNLRPSLGAVAFVGAEDGQKLGRDRCRYVQSLFVLVVGDRQVEGRVGESRACAAYDQVLRD